MRTQTVSDMKPSPRPQPHAARANKHVRTDHATGHSPSKIAVKPLPEESLQDILAAHPNPLLLILDCIQDPHNLGAILRTANAAGVHAVIAPKDKSVGITETVVRVSVGAAERIPFINVTNLSRTMKQIQSAGIWIVGTSDQGTQSIYQTDLRGPTAIVMGAEGEGMRRLTQENCDFLVQIPMLGTVPCLNVSVATGVCLFEALRQRTAH